MDINKLSIKELKEELLARNVVFKSKDKKDILKNMLLENLRENGEIDELREQKTPKVIDEETKKKQKEVINRRSLEEKIRQETHDQVQSKINNNGKHNIINRKEAGVVKSVSNDLIDVARKNGNIVDDITVNVKLTSKLGSDYNKLVFAKIEHELAQKNITITYTSLELEEEISLLRAGEDTEHISEEEMNFSIDNLLKGIGHRQETDEVKNFLSTINDYPLLSQEKEMEIGQIISDYHEMLECGIEPTFFERERYEDARELLSLSNKRLVVSVAKKYVNRGLDLIDLVMEGMLGLEKAILKYNYSLGLKFSTYATWWVRQGITRAIADKSKTIRVPVHMVETINKVTKVQRELTQQLGQEPTYEEIGAAVNPPMSVSEIEHIFNIAKDPISLEMPIGDDNSSLESFIEDDKNPSQDEESEKSELRRKLLGIIEEIPDREGEVLLYRYGLYDLNVEPLQQKAELLQEIYKELEDDTISSIEAQLAIENSVLISEKQRMKYSKRLSQNNEKFEKKYSELQIMRAKKDSKKSNDKIQKLEKIVDTIKSNNLIYLEKIIDTTEEQINILGEIDKLTGGVVKALTLEEVGQLFDVTRERIRQIETKGKRKLKAFADKEQLGLYIHE